MIPVSDYSFAVEYHGPPLAFDIPRAVPINVETIPVASVVAEVCSPEKSLFPVVPPVLVAKFPVPVPVVQPVVSPEFLGKTMIRDIGLIDCRGDCVPKEVSLGSEATVSPTSVIGFEDSSGTLEFLNGGYGSGELSEVINSSTALDSSISCEHSNELLGGTGSSGLIGFSESFERSRELSGSLGTLKVSNSGHESLDFDDSNPLDWTSIVSTSNIEYPDYPSSEISSLKPEECGNLQNSDSRRTPIVTFRDIEFDDNDGSEEFSSERIGVSKPKKEHDTKTRKGSCYRCFKGNRFTEKEICIVCDAKYCSNCVLRAMGSMPEGRKCVTCIGSPIDELKRGSLGKCSRMLKRLLNELEVRHVMKAEKLCEANQLQPHHLYVNGKPLSQEELVLLQSCSNPPKKLKPGEYWYDKVSGLWGKEGQKPSKIISPHLNVGGPIQADASNGNTEVFINGREITKPELRMLQLAGVQCAGNPHFWLNDDGSYQEEGQKNTKGFIWGKPGTKLVCAFLSLPVPSKATNSCDQVSNLVSRTVPNYIEHRTLQKLLLVGCNGSGTSTIFKQAKILYKPIPFSEGERENVKLMIQSNVYGYLGILLEGRERFEDESWTETRKEKSYDSFGPSGNADEHTQKSIYSIGPKLKAFSDWLLKTMVSGNLGAIFPAATREYAPLVEEFWNDAAIQATYKRRSELEMLPSVASYFLEQAVDILSPDYEPSDLDILYAEGVTSSNGLACVDFSFPKSAPEDSIDPADQHDSLLRYQLIRVHSKGLGENLKWLEMFEDVGIVIFCVSLIDYDQFSTDTNGVFTNKMLLTKKFFETIVTHPTFDQTEFLLILNKFDIFEEKIEQVPLSHCEWFNDFRPLMTRHRSNPTNSSNINASPSLGQLGFHYIAVKFKRLFESLVGRKLYVSSGKGLEPGSVDHSLRYAREILKWDDERINFGCSEYSFYSTEASSFSP